MISISTMSSLNILKTLMNDRTSHVNIHAEMPCSRVSDLKQDPCSICFSQFVPFL